MFVHQRWEACKCHLPRHKLTSNSLPSIFWPQNVQNPKFFKLNLHMSQGLHWMLCKLRFLSTKNKSIIALQCSGLKWTAYLFKIEDIWVVVALHLHYVTMFEPGSRGLSQLTSLLQCNSLMFCHKITPSLWLLFWKF